MTSSARLVMVAGEASGDELGAELALALLRNCPDTVLAGAAGSAMKSAGVEAWLPVSEFEVMGLAEVLSHLPRLFRLRKKLYRRSLDWDAQCFVGVDAPDFNLGLARRLRKRGLLAAQYVCPAVWAWRPWRIGRIARSVDLLLALFPFEPALFRHTGLDVRFVGHPLADRLPLAPDRGKARRDLGLADELTVIGLLPGSRPGEILRHASLVADTASRLRRVMPDAEFLVLLANIEHRELFLSCAGEGACEGLDFRIGLTRAGITAADAVVAASGTVTLEAFLLKTPMVVFYVLAPATYRIARGLRLVQSRHVALPNILAGRDLVPEHIQHQATPERLSADILSWLESTAARKEYTACATEMHEQLARNAADQAAGAILERLADR